MSLLPRKKQRQRRQAKRQARPLRLESLEDRRLMAVDFAPVAAEFAQEVDSIARRLESLGGTVDIPLTDAAFDVVGAHAAGQLRSAATTVGGALAGLGRTADPGAVQTQLARALGEVGSENGLPIPSNDVQVAFSNNDRHVDLAFQLNTSRLSTAQPFNFGLGVDHILAVRSQNDVHLESNVTLDVMMGVDSGGFYFDVSRADELSVQMQGELASDLSMRMGFLEFQAQSSNPGKELDAALVVDLGNGTFEPRLSGQLDVRMQLDGHFTGQAGQLLPSAGAELRYGWTFDNVNTETTALAQFGSAPTAVLADVWIDAGDYLAGVLGPVVNAAQTFTRPLQPYVDVFTRPIPGLSDLSREVGLGDVTLMTLMGHFEDYNSWRPATSTPSFGGESVLGSSAKLIRALDIINDIEASSGSLRLNLGDFSLAGAQSADLRRLAGASDLIVSAARPIGLDQAFNSLINSGVEEVAEQAGFVQGFMDEASFNLNVEFPLLENPAAGLFQLFVGQHADLVRLSGNWKDEWSERVPLLNFYGVSLGLEGELNVDAQFALGYDTRGFATGSVFDGIYVDADSRLNVGARLAGYFGADVEVLNVELQGGLETNPDGIKISLHDPDNDGKVRLGESSKLFELEGHLAAALSIVVEVGVELPFIGHVGPSFRHELARHVLLDSRRDIAEVNPWTPPPAPVLGVVRRGASGAMDRLELTMGPQAGLRGANFQEIDESYQVEHVGGAAGNESVIVSAFGYRQQFDGVRTIVADGGTGNDTIEIFSNVLSDVDLSGGDGNDVLNAFGSGAAALAGGAGDDLLEAGLGSAVARGNDGRDHLQAGRGGGYFDGGAGDDSLAGGPVAAVLVGGLGNDNLDGGLMHDRIYGGSGDDVVNIGQGGATAFPGLGRNDVNWEAGDGATLVDEAGQTNINIVGSARADRVEVASAGQQIQIDVTTSRQTIGVKDLFGKHQEEIEGTLYEPAPEIGIHFAGGMGADRFEVFDMTGTRVTTVSANLNQVQAPDAAADTVILHGGSQRDVVAVEQTAYWDRGWSGPPEGRPHTDFGGVMSVTGLPAYVAHVANDGDRLQLLTGDGDDVVTLFGTTGATDVFAGNGDDTVRVQAVQVTDQLGAVGVNAGAGANRMVMDYGQVDEAMRLYLRPDRVRGVIDDSSTNKLFSVQLVYRADGGTFDRVDIHTGREADRIVVGGADPSTTTAVRAGQGDDLIHLAQSPYGIASPGTFVADGGDGVDRVIAANVDNDWRVEGLGRGRLNGSTQFEQMESLSGGSRDDRFLIQRAGQVDVIHGGGGGNTLDYSSWTIPVQANLRLGQATAVGQRALAIQSVIGGAGDDLLVGGLASDHLSGGGGSDVLIGNAGSDTLEGGAGRDLLIGGSTVWDLDMPALTRLHSDWSAGQTQDVLDQLRRTPVLEDNAVDRLFGGDDGDFFFGRDEELWDFVAGDQRG